MLEKLADIRKPKVLILNKVDTVDKPPLLDLAARANASGKVRRHLHALGAERRRCRRSAGYGWRRMCRPGPGSIRKTRSPTRRRARSRPRSRAKSCSCGCIRNCPTSRRSRPNSGKNCATARCASSRPSMWSARASVRSCSAKTDRRSSRSARNRARNCRRCSSTRCICSCSSRCAKGWGDDPERYREMGLEFPKE